MAKYKIKLENYVEKLFFKEYVEGQMEELWRLSQVEEQYDMVELE